MRRREKITPQEQQECQRLKAAWIAWQDRHGHRNQQLLADQLGISQGAVSHYLNGRNAINAGLLVKIKKVLGVDPSAISGRIAAELSPLTLQATGSTLSDAERDLIDYIRAHGATDAQRSSVARQLLIAARAFLDRPVADEIVERAGFNAAKRRQPAKK